MLQIKVQVGDGGVDSDFILPLKIGPHLAEFRIRTGSGHNVIHDVDVDVVEHDHIAVRSRASHVVNDISKDDSILSRSHLHTHTDKKKQL